MGLGHLDIYLGALVLLERRVVLVKIDPMAILDLPYL
jgi:hypothetical protein